ncbi:MAG: hypothetical protein GY792_29870, partial [Gammaproteobacteria bacterium]|nr:hypothetical protein [Gammaproteobacteria bacterium]
RLWKLYVPYDVPNTPDGYVDAISRPGDTAFTETFYDALGRVKTVIATDETETLYAYGISTVAEDGVDGMLKEIVTDPNTNTTKTLTSPWGRVKEVHPEIGPWTKYYFDTTNQLTMVEQYQAGGTTLIEDTTMTYDRAGRKLTMDDPDMGAWAYTYNALGNLETQTDARGCTITFDYDALSRLTHKAYSGVPTSCDSTLDVTYLYDDYSHPVFNGFTGGDAIGMRTGMIDGSGYAFWAFDNRARLIKETKHVSGVGAFTSQWGYYASNQVKWMIYPDGERLDYGYHNQGALDSLTTNETIGAYVEGSSYDNAGRLTSRVLESNTLNVDYEYYDWDVVNGMGRLRQLTAGASGAPTGLQYLVYTYDAVGNILSIADHNAGGTQTQSFTYDALNRLETAQATGGTGGAYPLETYSYDSAGRLNGLPGMGTYSYSSSHIHAVTKLDGVQKYWYDAVGNQTQRIVGGKTYDLFYDAENRIYKAEENDTALGTYVYDGDGNRVKAIVDGEITVFIGNHYEITLSPTVEGMHWAVDEGAGDLLLDASGNNIHGAIQGATWTSGVNGQALEFDGETNYVAFEHELALQDELTVSAWVRPETGPNGLGRVVVSTHAQNGGGNNRVGWTLGDQIGNDNHFRFRVFGSEGNATAEYNGFFTDYANKWVHVTGVYKPGRSVTLYINGVKVAEDTSNVPASIALSDRFKIGARADNTHQGHWDGQIDDVRIIGRALSEREIQALVNVGVWQFNEGSGSLALDASGNNNHGTIQGATWTSGMAGQALEFDGETNYVAFEHELALQGEMTVSAWVRPETGPDGVGRVVVSTHVQNGGGNNRLGWTLGDQHGSDDHFRFRVFGSEGNAAAGYNGFFTDYDEQWVHVTGVYKPGQSVALYINGVKVAENTSSSVPVAIALSGRFKIGARADTTAQGHWDGQINDVRIAGRALSESEIQELMNVGIWRFNEGSGSLALDASGSGQHGAIQGATWTSGVTGYALDFDGTSDYVAFDHEPALQGELTVSAWVRPRTGPDRVGRLVVNTYLYDGGDGNQRGWFLGDEHGDTDYFYFRVHGPGGDYAAAIYGGFFAEYDDQWVHVTG